MKVPGTDDIYDFIPAPGEISEEGTLINKATLLSDATAAMYGLSADAVPDDILKWLYRPIGIIENTVRIDLGEKWLLCNGDEVDASVYPELADILNPSLGEFTNQIIATNINGSEIRSMTYDDVNNLYVAVATPGGSRVNAYICTSSNVNGPWAQQVFPHQSLAPVSLHILYDKLCLPLYTEFSAFFLSCVFI